MATSISTTSEHVLVAIDIAKLKHDIFVKLPDGKTKTFKIANNHVDFDKLSAYLKSLNRPCKIALRYN